jgi:glucoamylase
VEKWTATTNGPYSDKAYYLRLTKDANPNDGSTYGIGDSGPTDADERTVVDPSFLELVRLGVKRPDDPAIVDSIKVVDDKIAVDTPNGRFWHRFNFDGYGEQRDGSPWDVTFRQGSQATLGRAWPIFAGERGEYELAAGGSANARLAAMAGAANDGGLLPEQVWDDNPPSGQPGFPTGEGTLSATPLAWSHAQFVRLAWSIDAGHPVEQPRVVACRYARAC